MTLVPPTCNPSVVPTARLRLTPVASARETASEGLFAPPVREIVSSAPSDPRLNVRGCVQVSGALGAPWPSRVRHKESAVATSLPSLSNLVAEIGRLLAASLDQFETRT